MLNRVRWLVLATTLCVFAAACATAPTPVTPPSAALAMPDRFSADVGELILDSDGGTWSILSMLLPSTS